MRDYLIVLFFLISCPLVIYYCALEYIRQKYERKARYMAETHGLAPGSIWKHYRNNKKYTIQILTNQYARGIEWPLTVVYMANDNIVYSRPAHEFIRKFVLVDKESNEEPNYLSRIMSLAAFVSNKNYAPEIDSLWIHPYYVPTGEIDSHGKPCTELRKDIVRIRYNTDSESPCPYVIFKDPYDRLHTTTLHKFRKNFTLATDEDLARRIILSNRNIDTLHRSLLTEGTILTVKEVLDNEQVIISGKLLEVVLILPFAHALTAGTKYIYRDRELHILTNSL